MIKEEVVEEAEEDTYPLVRVEFHSFLQICNGFI